MGLFLFVFPNSSILDFGYATLDNFFTLAPWIMLFLVPTITMRSVADETNINAYEVQRSTDGINFTTIETVKAKNSSAATAYSIKDLTAKGGTNYYRLLIIEKGTSALSKIVSLNISAGKNSFVPRYISGKILNVTLNGINSGTYKIVVVNSNGQLVQSTGLQHDGSDQTKQITLKGNFATGIYRVALLSETTSYTGSILIQ
jgi:hypothetical protein